MREHPILGAVLFLIGAVLIAAAYAAGNAADTVDAVVMGHVLALNGALLATLGSGRHAPARLRYRRVAAARFTRA